MAAFPNTETAIPFMNTMRLQVALKIWLLAALASWISIPAHSSPKSTGMKATPARSHLPHSLPIHEWAPVWSVDTSPPTCPPVIAKGIVFQVCSPSLDVIRLTQHAVLWRRDLSDAISAPTSDNQGQPSQVFLTTPTVAGDLVIIGVSRGSSGCVIALNCSTGKQQWKFDCGSYDRFTGTTHGTVLSRPFLWEDRLIFRSGQGLTAINLIDGKQRWSIPLDSALLAPFTPSADPTADKQAIYFNSDFGMAYAFDPRDGGHLWRTQTDGISIASAHGVSDIHMTCINCSPLLIKGKLIVTDGLGNIYGLSAKNGALIWRRKASYVFRLLFESGSFYAATSTGLLALDPNTGKLQKEFRTPTSIVRCEANHGRVIFARFPTALELFDLKSWRIIARAPQVNARQGFLLFENLLLVTAYEQPGQSLSSQLRAYMMPAP